MTREDDGPTTEPANEPNETTNGTTAVDAAAADASEVGGADIDHDPGVGDRRQHVSADVAPELFG